MANEALKAFAEAMPGWEAVVDEVRATKAGIASVDRIAPEDSVLRDRYLGKGFAGYLDTDIGAQADTHSEFIRATKKGADDDRVSTKTFVVSGDKIVGSQG